MEKITKNEKEKLKKKLINRLDSMSSFYVRNKETRCVSCGKELDFEDRQCGHFIRRGVWITRWDPNNIHVECAACNAWSPDHLIGYSKWMIDNGLFDKYHNFYLKNKESKENEFNYTMIKGYYYYWLDKMKEIPNDIVKDNWSDLKSFDCLGEPK